MIFRIGYLVSDMNFGGPFWTVDDEFGRILVGAFANIEQLSGEAYVGKVFAGLRREKKLKLNENIFAFIITVPTQLTSVLKFCSFRNYRKQAL